MRDAQSPGYPSGTVSFLFTDIEGSTKLWQSSGEGMSVALSRHDKIVRDEIVARGGYIFKTVGDAFCAAFHTPYDAVNAAIDAQKALNDEKWTEATQIRVRMAVHAGSAEERGGDYFGPTVNRIARIMSAAHGGQILVSQTVFELIRDDLPPGVNLVDKGEHLLKDLQRPENLYQIVASGMLHDFPPLRSLDTRKRRT